jgi:hypothetical protein
MKTFLVPKLFFRSSLMKSKEINNVYREIKTTRKTLEEP